MKKMLNGIMPGWGQMIQKIWLVMRLTIFLTFIFLFKVSAEVYSQQSKLTLKLDNVPLEQVFQAIHEQSGYDFFYKTDQIPSGKRVSVDYKNKQVGDILEEVLKGTNLGFYVLDQDIVITPGKYQKEQASQQVLKVTGKVIDVQGQPLPGVTVVIKGMTNGTITDADGNYTIGNVPVNAVLTFSFVGMRSQDIEVGGKKVINIRLEEETIGLEEVVAIGYGTVKKSDLTGAVGSVGGQEIAERQVTQISQALQGAISGVTVTRDNSAPGATATIRIRGITSIGDSDPLIIVDGVPVDDINDINPNDVEDISVLKDAASASIYGSRAAAGVILVTTKRAKIGEIGLTYNYEFGLEKPTRLPDYVGAVRYMQMVNELRWNDNGNIEGGEYPTYTEDIVNNYASLHEENPDLYPDTDWNSLILKNDAPRQSHMLSITAGSKTIRTKASLAYDETDGLYTGKKYKRFTTRFNNDISINKYLSASLDFYAKRSISESPSMDPIYYMRISAPVYAAAWSNGLIAEGKSGANIYGQLKYGGYKHYWYNQIGGKVSLDFSPLDGLKLTVAVSPDFGFDKGKEFLKKVQYTDYDDPTTYVGTLQWASSTSLTETRDDNYRVTSQFLANYVKSFGKHSLNLLAGYEDYHAFNEDLEASSDQMELSSYPYLDLGNENYLSNEGSAYENAYHSYFGRIMYNYDSKYFFQGNIRYDGSSRFAKDYRWGAFPSFSAGWVLSEESFMKDIPNLSFLKLRASWGTLGNERIGNYPYQSTIDFYSALFYEGNEVVSAQTAAQTQYAIKDISWETTESFDFGVDADFLRNKLQFSGDYYKKVTKDMLLELEIPDYIGFDNPDQNTGKMHTKGWEVSLGWNDKIGPVKYAVSANVSDFKSVMGDLGGIEIESNNQVNFKGSQYLEWYGYQSDGIFQTQDDVDNSAVLNSNVAPGDIKYKDISGPDGVPDGTISSDYDRVLLGGSLPRYTFGGNIRLEYKNLDFSLVFQGVGKQNVRKTTMMAEGLLENWGNFPALIDGKYWSNYNTDAQNLKATYPRLSYNSVSNNYAMSDFWMFNGGYFRLKNLTLGYTIPALWAEKLRIQSIRVFGTVSDFLSIDKYPRGWDPESSASGYPITASFTFGASVKF